MKTFIYQDEKSHKFWAVEQQDNELHLSWGKVGTSGQKQIKTFADAAAASKAGQQLINEKTAKATLSKAKPRRLRQPACRRNRHLHQLHRRPHAPPCLQT